MSSLLLTAPICEPVSLPEAQEQLSIDAPEHDAKIKRMIIAARVHVENRINRVMVRQEHRLYFNSFGTMKLEPGVVQNISQIQYVDTDGATQTLATTVYELDIPNQLVRLSYNQSWPARREQNNAIWVDFFSGYFTSTNSPIEHVLDIPQPLKSAMLLVVEDLFANRGIKSEVELFQNDTFDNLICSYVDIR